jgi:chemotaxis protein MotB
MVRKPGYLQAEKAGRERWLISYTDILTLLLILFIAMAAHELGHEGSSVEAKAQVPASNVRANAQNQAGGPSAASATPAGQASARAATPVSPPPPATQTAPAPPRPAPVSEPATSTPAHEALLQAEERLKKTGLDLHRETRGLIISLPQAILFGSGDDRINRSAQPIIAEIADVLRSLDNKVELAGHADSVPIHTSRFQSNWELSAARGLSLLNSLTKDHGIAESRLTVSSHGSYSPKSSNDTADGRAENRRVEILILDEETHK